MASSPIDRVRTQRPAALALRERLRTARAQRLARDDSSIALCDLDDATRWRRERLCEAHAGALASPWEATARFLIQDVLTPADARARIELLERALPVLARFATDGFLRGVADAVELHILGHDLDMQLVRALADRDPAAAIQQLARNPYHSTQRARETELLRAIARRLGRVSQSTRARTALAAARVAATPLGFGVLIGILERGVQAFENLPDASFMRHFVERNRLLLETGGASPRRMPATSTRAKSA